VITLFLLLLHISAMSDARHIFLNIMMMMWIKTNGHCLYQSDHGFSNKKAQLTQGLRAPSFQDGRQPPSWTLSNRK